MKVALVVIGRLENRYAIEFVEYYKQLGIDNIFIIDNNFENEEHFEDVLQVYIDEGFVKLINKYRNVQGDIKNNIQIKAYKEIYNQISKDYDWIFYCDFDEYLAFKKDTNIKEYLSRDCFKNYNQILIHWKIYSDNGLVYDDGRPCLERFTVSTTNKRFKVNRWFNENQYVKPIIRTKIKDINICTNHNFTNELVDKTTCNNCGEKLENYSHNFTHPINYNLAYIKHFITKTIDEWINNKQKKGVGDRSIEEFKNSYPIERFFRYNSITKEKIDFIKSKGYKYDMGKIYWF